MKNPNPIEIIGVGLVKLSELLSHNSISVLFQKGIGLQLIHKIIEINKSKILDKKTGFLIDLISNYTVYIHFFENNRSDILAFIYLDEKEKILKFSDLFHISEKYNNFISSNRPILEFKQACNKEIIIPKSDGVIAIFIITSSGHLLYSKINKEKTKFENVELQICGFISALIIFSKELIGSEPGVNLKKINFGNKYFYINLIENVIFAYLIEETKGVNVNKRYMQLISEEFLSRYKECLSEFKGDIIKFRGFNTVIDQYFCI